MEEGLRKECMREEGQALGAGSPCRPSTTQPTTEVGWCSLPGHTVKRLLLPYERLLSEVPWIRRQAPGAPLCQAASRSASGPSTACRLSSGSDKAPRVPGASVFVSRGKRPQVRASRKRISLIKLWAGPHSVQRLQGKGFPGAPGNPGVLGTPPNPHLQLYLSSPLLDTCPQRQDWADSPGCFHLGLSK